MLRQLRFKLTFISTVITGGILTFICILALQFFEDQLSKNNHLSFDNYLNTISYQLQHNHVIKHSWLAQLEIQHHLVIHIEDNGTPFLFKGAWQPSTPRENLIASAKAAFLDTSFTRLIESPPSYLSLEKTFLTLYGESNDTYRVGISMIPSPKGLYTLTVIQDLSQEHLERIRIRYLFIGISLLGISLLAGFSYWFSGRAIRPIELAQKKQKDFIASASHELKAPLAVIQAHASSQALSATAPSVCEPLQKECIRMSKLIDDLLLLATLDHHTWRLHLTPVALDTLLIELFDLYLPLASKKQQHLYLELPEDFVPTLELDQERIQQVLCILLDNALHYVGDGGDITLQLLCDTHTLTIIVRDHGPGIPLVHQPFIFDRFYQVDSSRQDKNHYGLGLSIAKEILACHSGTLSFVETLGGGATFIIRLPHKKW